MPKWMGGLVCINFQRNLGPFFALLHFILYLLQVTMDWLGKMLNLPSHFLFQSGGHGGGVIQVRDKPFHFGALKWTRFH